MGDKERKLVKQIFLYRDSHLPKKGWIQSCMHCYLHTERTILFHTIHQKKDYYNKFWEFHAHLCNPCKKKLLQKKNSKNIEEYLKFQKKCYAYMKNLYPYLFSKYNEDDNVHKCHCDNEPTCMEEIYL